MDTWDKSGRAVIEFPKYYRPDVGEGFRCTLTDATASFTEELYCAM